MITTEYVLEVGSDVMGFIEQLAKKAMVKTVRKSIPVASSENSFSITISFKKPIAQPTIFAPKQNCLNYSKTYALN